MIAQLLLSLTVLVFIHELGHYLAARLFKMKVDKFYIFFDFLFPLPTVLPFSLFKKKVGDTEYGIGWFPLGGYVKIAGMMDENMDAEQLASEPKPWEYRSKPAWQRFIVLIAGIVFNVVLAVFMFITFFGAINNEYLPLSELNKTGIYATELGKEFGFKNGDKIIGVNGKMPLRFSDVGGVSTAFGGTINVERNGKKMDIDLPRDMYRYTERFAMPLVQKVEVHEVFAGSNAQKAALQKGDRFLKVDGQPVKNFYQFKGALGQAAGKNISITVNRNGQPKQLMAAVGADSTLGFSLSQNIIDEGTYTMANYSFGQAVKYGLKQSKDVVTTQILAFGRMFTGEISVRQISGPVGMAEAFGGVWDWSRFWQLTASISMMLAFINLLPIPVLDGGHLVFVTYEIITGKKPPERILMTAQVIGMIMVMILLVFTFGNDILKLIGI